MVMGFYDEIKKFSFEKRHIFFMYLGLESQICTKLGVPDYYTEL